MLSAVLAVLVLLGQSVSAESLDAQQQQTLLSLDSQTAKELVEFAVEVKSWQEQLQRVRQAYQQLAAGDLVDPAHVDRVLNISDSFQQRVAASPHIAQLIEAEERLAVIWREAESKWNNVPFDPETHEGVTEEDFRRELKRKAESEAARAILDHFDTVLLDQVQELHSPAAYLRGYLDKVFKDGTGGSMTAADGSLEFRVIQPADNVSIFSPDANIGIEIEYVAEAITVQATGLYFRYKEPIPEPVIDNLRIDAQAAALAGATKKVMSLGNEQLAKLSQGKGFSVTIDKLPSFGSGGNRHIEFTVSFDAKVVPGADVAPIKATASKLQLHPGNRVEVGDAKLELTATLTTPIPIANSGFGFWEFGGSYDFGENMMGANTAISTIATPTDAIGLYAGIETGPPFQVFNFTGRLAALKGELVLCSLDKGTIDFGKGRIAAQFTTGGSGIMGKLFLQQGSFEMTSERAVLNGRMEVFGQRCANMRMMVDFQNQAATIEAETGFELFGTDFSSTLSGEVHSGFRRVTLSAVQSVKVETKLGDISCTVEVEADSGGSEPVTVKTKAFGAPIRFSVGSLSDCTTGRLLKEVEKVMTDAYHHLLNELAKGESQARDWANQLDDKMARYVSEKAKNVGIDKISTGIPEIDKPLGKGSEYLKNVGGAASDFSKQTGAVLTGGRVVVQDAVSKSGSWASDRTGGLISW